MSYKSTRRPDSDLNPLPCLLRHLPHPSIHEADRSSDSGRSSPTGGYKQYLCIQRRINAYVAESTPASEFMKQELDYSSERATRQLEALDREQAVAYSRANGFCDILVEDKVRP